MCGCGNPDTDSDSDGAADCAEQCPADPERTTPGQCGCLGHPSLKDAGTACTDGLCSANDECDGQGHCGFPQECAPVGNCTVHGYQGRAYAFCPTDKSWQGARTSCQAVTGMDLAHIGNAPEDAFVHQHLPAPAWIGATDSAAEGKWIWADDGVQFWTGKGNA